MTVLPLPREIEAIAERALADRSFACCALSLRSGGPAGARSTARGFFGSPDPADQGPGRAAAPLSPDALFDLASLTKPLATTLLTLLAADRGALNLDAEARVYLPGSRALSNGATVRQLLLHGSGLPAVPALQRFFPSPIGIDRGEAADLLLGIGPEAPPGVRVEYSCTGFLVLGLVLERLGGGRLGELFEREIALPLGLKGRALFRPGVEELGRCVPTEACPWRGRRLRGEVHDESSWCLGGDGGNAGLFADLAAVEVLFSVYETGGGILPESSVLEARRCATEGKEQRRGLGLLLSSPAPGWGADTYGHTGFTGNSIWRDPGKNLQAIVLSNRVYYGREESLPKIQAFRTALHGAAAARTS